MKKLFIILTFVFNLIIFAADYNASAIASISDVFVGDTINIDFIVKSKDIPKDIFLRSNKYWSVKLISPFKKLDDSQDIYQMRYEFVPRKFGKLEIPSLTITSNDEKYLTNPLNINVKEPIQSESMYITSNANPKSAFVGEVIVLKYEWHSLYPLNLIKSLNMNLPVFENKNFKIFENKLFIDENDKWSIGIPVHNTRIIGKAELLQYDSLRNAYGVSFELILIPKRAGVYALGDAEIICGVPSDLNYDPNKVSIKSFQYPSYFDNEFFNYDTLKNHYKKEFFRGGNLSIEIKPIPIDDMPKDFFYAIGDFSISSKISEKSLRVGDTTNLEVVIEAKNGSRLENISLNKSNFSAKGFDNFEFSSDIVGSIKGNKKTFLIPLLVLSVESVKVPSITFSFFNPNDLKYYTVKTEEIGITVAPSQSARLVTSSGESVSIKTSLNKNALGIYDVIINEDTFKNRSDNFIAGISFNIFLYTIFIPPLIFILIHIAEFIFRFFSKDSKHKDILKLKIKIKRISKNAHSSQIDDLIKEFFSIKISMKKNAVCFVDIEKWMREKNCNENLILELRQICENLTAINYSNFQEFDSKKSVRSLKYIIRKLEKI